MEETVSVSGIPGLHYAVADAVASLTRLRIRQDGPFLLERPRSILVIEKVDEESDAHGTTVRFRVTCPSWGTTSLILPLTSQTERTDWLAWGEFAITYGVTPHPALSGKTIKRRIDPSFATSDKGLPMRYRVRIPVSR